MHFTNEHFGGMEVEVAVDVVEQNIAETEDDMQSILDMVLRESPRDQKFAYQPVAYCNDKRQHQPIALATATATAQASAVAMTSAKATATATAVIAHTVSLASAFSCNSNSNSNNNDNDKDMHIGSVVGN